jgi:hypothetical protein
MKLVEHPSTAVLYLAYKDYDAVCDRIPVIFTKLRSSIVHFPEKAQALDNTVSNMQQLFSAHAELVQIGGKLLANLTAVQSMYRLLQPGESQRKLVGFATLLNLGLKDFQCQFGRLIYEL